jgi:hypothetical protein
MKPVINMKVPGGLDEIKRINLRSSLFRAENNKLLSFRLLSTTMMIKT